MKKKHENNEESDCRRGTHTAAWPCRVSVCSRNSTAFYTQLQLNVDKTTLSSLPCLLARNFFFLFFGLLCLKSLRRFSFPWAGLCAAHPWLGSAVRGHRGRSTHPPTALSCRLLQCSLIECSAIVSIPELAVAALCFSLGTDNYSRGPSLLLSQFDWNQSFIVLKSSDFLQCLQITFLCDSHLVYPTIHILKILHIFPFCVQMNLLLISVWLHAVYRDHPGSSLS